MAFKSTKVNESPHLTIPLKPPEQQCVGSLEQQTGRDISCKPNPQIWQCAYFVVNLCFRCKILAIPADIGTVD